MVYFHMEPVQKLLSKKTDCYKEYIVICGLQCNHKKRVAMKVKVWMHILTSEHAVNCFVFCADFACPAGALNLGFSVKVLDIRKNIACAVCLCLYHMFTQSPRYLLGKVFAE